jgi:hypothetical protein
VTRASCRGGSGETFASPHGRAPRQAKTVEGSLQRDVERGWTGLAADLGHRDHNAPARLQPARLRTRCSPQRIALLRLPSVTSCEVPFAIPDLTVACKTRRALRWAVRRADLS